MGGALLGALLLLSAAVPAAAHDFWIEPSSFAPAAGAAVSFHLRVGQQWVGDAVPRDSRRVARFELVGPAGSFAIAGAEAVDPAGLARVGAPGLYVAGYASNNTPLELEPAKFEEYLRLEGLEWALAERSRRGESDQPSREVYARCAKSLLRVGAAAADGGFDRVLGFTLEIVPQQDPSAMRAGDVLAVRVLYQGRPLRDALVVAMPKSAPAAAVAARSDAAGGARLRLASAGTWMVKAVHLVRLEGETAAAEGADWQSYWASLTFSVP